MYEKINYYKIFMGIGLLILSLLLIVQSASAINISVSTASENSIIWVYDIADSASLDGAILPLYDNRSIRYTANNLQPNSSHTMCVYSGEDYKCSTTHTLPSTDGIKSIVDTIAPYILFLLGLLCVAVGFKEPIAAFAGFVFGCIGLLTALDNSFTMGTLFMILIVASIFVAFKGEQ